MKYMLHALDISFSQYFHYSESSVCMEIAHKLQIIILLIIMESYPSALMYENGAYQTTMIKGWLGDLLDIITP